MKIAECGTGAENEKANVPGRDESLSKPFHEAAEEFAAILVNIVATLTTEPDGRFTWFKRETWTEGTIQARDTTGKIYRSKTAWIPTPDLLKRLEYLPDVSRTYTVPVNAPLIVRPRPWEIGSLHKSGYYTRDLSFFKFHLKNERIRDFLNECAQPDLVPVLEAVNTLQATPFRINQRVWNVVQQLRGRSNQLKQRKIRGSGQEIDSWIKNHFMPKVFDKGGPGPGDRVANPLTRQLVEDLAGGEGRSSETFYFAYQADFRGRLYAVAQWLSPQGGDLSKALLEFGVGKPISDEGARYLAIHGSQQQRFEAILRDLGIEQNRPLTLEERVQWIQQNEPSISLYATDPLKHTGWTHAKQPFQFLAFCFAWADYRAQGAKSICNLPVQVDGVCNGLQHIAALTGDKALAAATNLIPGDPQDIYLDVRNRVLRALERVEDPDPYTEFAIKHRLIDRDLAKSIVMIIPYGAGKGGYTRAVRDRFRQRMFPRKKSFKNPTESGREFIRGMEKHFVESFEIARADSGQHSRLISEHLSVLALKISGAFKTVLNNGFPAIEKFRQRLSSSAKVAWTNGIPMMWQSPSGFPVIQRKFKVAQAVVDSRISSAVFGNVRIKVDAKSPKAAKIKFTTQRLSNEVNKRDQASGMLANFIHSLDSAHLIKSIWPGNPACAISA